MKTMSKSLSVLGQLALVLATSTLVVRAQNGITASGVLTFVPGAGSTYNYTLTINNSASSLSPIGSFWYAWIPGQFYLPTTPSSEGTPPNWTATPANFDVSSIQFVAATAGAKIAPGGSLSFTFVSTDTPATLAGNAPNHPGTPIGTTVAYANGLLSDLGDTFVVASVVPEPSSTALSIAGLLGLLVMARHKQRVSLRPVLARCWPLRPRS